MRGPHLGTPLPAPLPLRTVGDLRAAEVSSEADLSSVASVIVDYRGRIRLCQDPDFGTAVHGQADHPHQERTA
ncbi:hypothetical protein [Streptomyces canus]|uniref:hypothetical protein n=1 Tax=Streptomyces canus TaxID=58343 RepID=UPI0007C54710|nr:hypothetical protein [Streptomyces canus]